MEKAASKTAIIGGGTAARSLPVRWRALAHIIFIRARRKSAVTSGFEYRVRAILWLFIISAHYPNCVQRVTNLHDIFIQRSATRSR